MEIWIRVLILQAGVFALSTVVGVLLFRLPLMTAILASLLVAPTPLFKVSAGAAGFIYVGDLLAIVLLARMMLGGAGPAAPHTKGLRALVFATVIVLPVISTVLGFMVDSENRLYKPVLLGIMRSIGYYAVFAAFIRRTARSERPDSELALQCTAFFLISLCGLAQFATGINLDLWTTIRQLGIAETRDAYGRGFMGMYRGAVGAFGVGIMAVLPVVMTGRRLASITLPVMAATVLAVMMAVGSRQGVMIGLLVFFLGLAMSVRARPAGSRLRAFVQGSAGLFLLMAIGLIGWAAYAPYGFQKYVGRRFEALMDPEKVMEAVQKRDRRFPQAFSNVISNPHLFLIGAGYGVEFSQAIGGGGELSMIYVDSEIMFTWQLGGTLLLGAYTLLLLKLRLQMRQRHWVAYEPARAAVGAAIVVLYGGILLMYGHFFILTTASHEAPIAYWTWALFGTAAGFCSRQPREATQPLLSEPLWDSEHPPFAASA